MLTGHFALSRIHTGNEAVQDKGVQRSDNAFHFRIVRYQQVARILRVAHFQVEVITVTVEYPVTLFGRQTRGIDAQCTDHTFQLFHRAIFKAVWNGPSSGATSLSVSSTSKMVW